MTWNRARRALCALHRGEEGAAMVEYAIVTAVIAVVALVAAQALGTAVTGVFEDITEALEGI